ncbi:hypothetical protein DV515_00018801, partial [Chloebia gouldiae]
SVRVPPIGHWWHRGCGLAAPGVPIGCLAVPEEEGRFPLAGTEPRRRHRHHPHGGLRGGRLSWATPTKMAAVHPDRAPKMANESQTALPNDAETMPPRWPTTHGPRPQIIPKSPP